MAQHPLDSWKATEDSSFGFFLPTRGKALVGQDEFQPLRDSGKPWFEGVSRVATEALKKGAWVLVQEPRDTVFIPPNFYHSVLTVPERGAVSPWSFFSLERLECTPKRLLLVKRQRFGSQNIHVATTMGTVVETRMGSGPDWTSSVRFPAYQPVVGKNG